MPCSLWQWLLLAAAGVAAALLLRWLGIICDGCVPGQRSGCGCTAFCGRPRLASAYQGKRRKKEQEQSAPAAAHAARTCSCPRPAAPAHPPAGPLAPAQHAQRALAGSYVHAGKGALAGAPACCIFSPASADQLQQFHLLIFVPMGSPRWPHNLAQRGTACRVTCGTARWWPARARRCCWGWSWRGGSAAPR